MIHYATCAVIAYFLARYLNARFPGWITAVWSGAAATFVGVIAGSVIVLGGSMLFGATIETIDTGSAMARSFNTAFLLSIVGAAAGIYQGRKKAATGEYDNVASIPAAALLGWGALAFVAVALIGVVITVTITKVMTVNKEEPPAYDLEWRSYTDDEVDEFLRNHEHQVTKENHENHYQAIHAAHPDAEAIIKSRAFENWRNSKTNADERNYIDFVIKNGTTDEVITMFTQFKRQTSWGRPQQQSQTRNRQPTWYEQQEARLSGCQPKDVMTDEEIERCRSR